MVKASASAYCENVSQPRRLAAEVTTGSGLSPGRGYQESLRPGAASIVTPASGTSPDRHSRSPFHDREGKGTPGGTKPFVIMGNLAVTPIPRSPALSAIPGKSRGTVSGTSRVPVTGPPIMCRCFHSTCHRGSKPAESEGSRIGRRGPFSPSGHRSGDPALPPLQRYSSHLQWPRAWAPSSSWAKFSLIAGVLAHDDTRYPGRGTGVVTDASYQVAATIADSNPRETAGKYPR